MFSPDFYVLNRSITLQNQNTKPEKTPQKSLIFVFAFRFFLFSFFLLLYLLLDSALILHLVTMYIVTRFYNNFLNNLYPISQATAVIYINIISFLQINSLEKDHSLIETRQLENIAIFLQTVIKFCFAWLGHSDIRKIFCCQSLSTLMKNHIFLLALRNRCELKTYWKENQGKIRLSKPM